MASEKCVATGVAIACLVDISRLVVYLPTLVFGSGGDDLALPLAAAAAACGGAMIGARVLHKTTQGTVQRIVAVMLVMVALGLITGIL